MKKQTRNITLGAAFLMATSAIGPGFLTQTTVFTAELGASFGFVILLSVLIDVAAQANIWRIVVQAGQRAPEIADRLLPGLGTMLTLLVAGGGLAFNIGNVAGAGLGLEVITGMPVGWGAAISTVLAAALFMRKEAGAAMDWFARILGLGMILLTAYVAVSARPPLGEMALRTFFPTSINWQAVLTLVGGTVGSYITFAGAHRLLDAGIRGEAQVPVALRSALTGIGVATLMRVLLFAAALGVVTHTGQPDPANPPASMFKMAAGEWGYCFFGLVMWAAAITSVVGATFTSLSFLQGSFPKLTRQQRPLTLAFLAISLLVFLVVGKPVKTLIVVGALNGLILPLGLAAMLLAEGKFSVQKMMGKTVWRRAGWAVVALMAFMAGNAVFKLFQ